MATAHSELEHTKRESLSKHEQDKVKHNRVLRASVGHFVSNASCYFFPCPSVFQNVIAALRYELKELRTEFEESLNSHENTKKSFAEQVRELNKQREHAEKEVRIMNNRKQEHTVCCFVDECRSFATEMIRIYLGNGKKQTIDFVRFEKKKCIGIGDPRCVPSVMWSLQYIYYYYQSEVESSGHLPCAMVFYSITVPSDVKVWKRTVKF